VLDAIVGQNGLVQPGSFLGLCGIKGVVLTELDGTAKDGITIAITEDPGVPIRCIGVGEQLDDLLSFSGTEFVDTLFEPVWWLG